MRRRSSDVVSDRAGLNVCPLAPSFHVMTWLDRVNALSIVLLLMARSSRHDDPNKFVAIAAGTTSRQPAQNG
jgi:hypothetical protein